MFLSLNLAKTGVALSGRLGVSRQWRKLALMLLCVASSNTNSLANWWCPERLSTAVGAGLERLACAAQARANTKTGRVLLGVTLAYALHRGWQWYKRCHSFTPIANSESVLPATAPVAALFAHGLGGDRDQAGSYSYNLRYHAANFAEFHSFNFQDADTPPAPACLGQLADILRLKAEYDRLVSAGYRVNLYGVSRGAVTVYNFLALYQPKNVHCAVLESPFDDLEAVIANWLLGVKHVPLLGGWCSASITGLITSVPLQRFGLELQHYSVYGINPCDVAQHIPQQIPLLFIACKGDNLIPHTSTMKLVTATQRAGHPHCYAIVTAYGSHANILWHSSATALGQAIVRFMQQPTQNPLTVA